MEHVQGLGSEAPRAARDRAGGIARARSQFEYGRRAGDGDRDEKGGPKGLPRRGARVIPAPSGRAGEAAAHAPASVLIVEDHDDSREALALSFASEEYRVVCAGSAEEALDLLRAGERVDLLVADYGLPGHTGAALIHQARNEGLLATTRSVIITAYGVVIPPMDVPVLHKPLDPDDVVAQVERALAAWKKREV